MGTLTSATAAHAAWPWPPPPGGRAAPCPGSPAETRTTRRERRLKASTPPPPKERTVPRGWRWHPGSRHPQTLLFSFWGAGSKPAVRELTGGALTPLEQGCIWARAGRTRKGNQVPSTPSRAPQHCLPPGVERPAQQGVLVMQASSKPLLPPCAPQGQALWAEERVGHGDCGGCTEVERAAWHPSFSGKPSFPVPDFSGSS